MEDEMQKMKENVRQVMIDFSGVAPLAQFVLETMNLDEGELATALQQPSLRRKSIEQHIYFDEHNRQLAYH